MATAKSHTRKSTQPTSETPSQPAEIVREYGPFTKQVHGVSYDGEHVWFATNEGLRAFDPATGAAARSLPIECSAGTAFDGRHLYQITAGRIQKIDRESGKVLSSIPAPGGTLAAGLTWAEGTLWVGQYRDRKIVQIDPNTGAVLRTLESNRFVTGVTWVDGDLWHATIEDGESEIRRIDPETGTPDLRLTLSEGIQVSGLESDGAELFYCGGAETGKVLAVRRPKRK
jgi:hypothetical protein